MDNTSLALLFPGVAVCSLLIFASFAAWFLLRETRRGDLACMIVASASALLLVLCVLVLRPLGFFGLPGLFVYLWFMGLRGSRRQQSRLRQWGRKQGYRVIAVENQYTPNPRSGPLRTRAEIRITARRLSDGQFLVGWVFDTGSGFDVVWDPLPTQRVGPGLHVPNPPNAPPREPSKE